MQRRLERAIRAQKRRVLLAGPEDVEPRKSRLTLLQQEYQRFSKGVGLRTEDERLEVSGFGPKQMRSIQSTPKLSVENTRNRVTMEADKTVGEDLTVHQIGRIDIEKYRVVTEQIRTDEVIITEERIQHIKERHPNDFERYAQYLQDIVENPQYILEDNSPYMAILLKEYVEEGKRFRLILRLSMHSDPADYKNSIITFLEISERKFQKYLRNKKILYKSE